VVRRRTDASSLRGGWAFWAQSGWQLSGFPASSERLVVNVTERLSCRMQPEWVYMLIYYKALYFSPVDTDFGRILGDGKNWSPLRMWWRDCSIQRANLFSPSASYA